MFVEDFIESSVVFMSGCIDVKVFVFPVGSIVCLVFGKLVVKCDSLADELSAS